MEMDLIKNGINQYLEAAFREGKIDEQSYIIAKENVFSNISNWLTDDNLDKISPKLKEGIKEAVKQEKWEDIVNAFRKKMSFGTGGIRGMMATNMESIIKLKEDGLDAKILKGPNLLNNIVLLQTSAGVAKFGIEKGFDKIVIGYDSRIRGFDFAKEIAELFLAYGYTVYLFDEPCPYPEVTFAIPYKEIKAHIGILISASHNDYRYNGYKLSCGNGSQFDPEERTDMFNNYIDKSTTNDIKLLSLNEVPNEKLIWLGGDNNIAGFDYCGHGNSLINIHMAHQKHVKSFLLQDQKTDRRLNISYCAFHGAGRKAIPRLLEDTGFKNINIIHENGLNDLNGLFPSFNNAPGMEQQPDPGDKRAAKVAIESFKKEYPGEWDKIDILIGTDPDADRCGVVVKVPENQRFLYKGNDNVLMPADDIWTLLLWYRLKFDKNIDPKKAFIVLSHTTTDALVLLSRKHNIGIIKTWVGFAAISAGIRDAWNKNLSIDLYEGKNNPDDDLSNMMIYETINMDNDKRTYNIGAFEQSNGFSILGSPPIDKFSLGVNGHVRDKDGAFASILIAEIAEWAKQNNTTIFELIDKNIYLDPDIGLFVNHYEPDPLDGEYPGIEGDRIKKSILMRVIKLYDIALEGNLKIAELPVLSAVIYRTGKYDHVYPVTPDFQFPDEGVRFYFDKKRLNHLTIRPSGTGNALRIHIQLHSLVNEGNLIDKKKYLHKLARKIADDIREKIGAPRSSDLL